jgi:hypothetical protein
MPDGAKPIEQFRPGDPILSAPDGDPSAPVEVATVEEVFVNYTRVLTLHLAVPTVRPPQPSTETSEKPPTALTIRTTGGHRFYVRGKGWLPAGELRPGDRLRSAHGPDPVVLALTDEQAETVVYNLRVAWYHTYFVGDRDWPCSVWAHNAYREFRKVLRRQVKDNRQVIKQAYALIKAGKVEEARALLAAQGVKTEVIERAINRANTLTRPSQWRVGFREKVEEQTRTPEGKPGIYDLDEQGNIILRERLPGEKGEIGHREGMEHHKLVQIYAQLTQKRFNDLLHSHPEWFRIETRRLNASHRGEAK